MTKCSRTVAVLALGAAALGAAGCGGSSAAQEQAQEGQTPTSQTRSTTQTVQPPHPTRALTVPGSATKILMGPIPGTHEQIVGRGTRAAVILRGAHPRADRPMVIFLHLWGYATPLTYGSWITHLTAGGSTVIYPISQDASTSAGALLENTTAGVAAAVRALPEPPRKVVVVGHTSGAALAMDYAATAKAAHVPVPAGIVAIYPGRDAGAGRILPAADASQIAPHTRIVVMTSQSNPIPGGDKLAKAAVRSATRVPASRRRLLVVNEPNPAGPTMTTGHERRAFWAPVDQMIDDLTTGQ